MLSIAEAETSVSLSKAQGMSKIKTFETTIIGTIFDYLICAMYITRDFACMTSNPSEHTLGLTRVVHI